MEMMMQECVYVGAPNIFSNDFSLDNIKCYLYTFLHNLFTLFGGLMFGLLMKLFLTRKS
jgi:hypothetical protein